MDTQFPKQFAGGSLSGDLFLAQQHFAEEFKNTHNQRYVVQKILEREFNCKLRFYADYPGRPPKLGRQFDHRDVADITFDQESDYLAFKHRYRGNHWVVKLQKTDDSVIDWLVDNVGRYFHARDRYKCGHGWRVFSNGDVHLSDHSWKMAFVLTFGDMLP
jgi:hypothetical protein